MQQFVLVILASFAGVIFAQTSGTPPPPELVALVPANLKDKATQAYNKLTPDQQAQAGQLAKSLNDQQKQQVQTLLADPAVQSGNWNQASPSTQNTAKQLCQSLSPQQQQGVIGLGNALGLPVPQQLCSATSGSGASPTGGSMPGAGGAAGPGVDTSPMCCMWAQMGECDRNPFWMKPNCPTACGTPGATVINAFSQPTKLSANCASAGMGTMGSMMGRPMGGGMGPGGMGSGSTGPGTMGPSSMGPGGMGPGSAGPSSMGPGGAAVPNTNTPQCYDVTEMCAFWGAMGECQNNPSWMRANCQRACRSCGGGVGGQFGGSGPVGGSGQS